MASRDKLNYPPSQKGYSCHHVAYPYHAYRGEIEHKRYQHNPALLQPTLNTRHNVGYLTVHALLDDKYGPPPKPSRPLMMNAIDFMEDLPRDDSRIRKLGLVIDFFMEEAELNPSPTIADQALDIANHYSMQYLIISEGGAAFMQRYETYYRGEAA